ncbi:hypothetical protein [Pararhizobium mangrovi]|uniref:Uncharacterized protein n=1 Tax=Pararhizobium mangrovi TaxID=2590452 RepID=A0A506UFT9_9HYPH|nr:hypothetical protein [Pararhizobium mangrovi]TPW31915.1 hypothetical protein FJU11_02865 [Pararhizobium mangrovi]
MATALLLGVAVGATPALAQNSDDGSGQFPQAGSTMDNGSTMTQGAHDVFMDDSDQYRSSEDSMKMYNDASSEDQQSVRDSCSDFQQMKASFMDHVSDLCNSVQEQ